MRNSDKRPEPNDQFGWWTIIEEAHVEGSRHDYNFAYVCRCRCGAVKTVRLRNLLRGKSTKCSRWCPLVPRKPKKPRGPGPKYRGLTSAGSGDRRHIRPYDIWRGLKRRNVLCDEWKDDFRKFLNYYLKISGFEYTDFLDPTKPWAYTKVTRIDPEQPFGPGNLLVVPFKTERAWHTPTYLYWRKLTDQGVLDQAMTESYVLFLTTFGIKERGHLLRRKDITQPHSAANSEWLRTKQKDTT